MFKNLLTEQNISLKVSSEQTYKHTLHFITFAPLQVQVLTMVNISYFHINLYVTNAQVLFNTPKQYCMKLRAQSLPTFQQQDKTAEVRK